MMRKVSVIGMCHGKGRIKSSIIFMLQKYAKGIKEILAPLVFTQPDRKLVILPRCQSPTLMDLQAFLLKKNGTCNPLHYQKSPTHSKEQNHQTIFSKDLSPSEATT